MNAQANTVNIGGDEVDIATLPQTSIVALLQRGINHVLGNEVASKVSTAKKATRGGDGPDKDEPKYTEAELAELQDKTFAEKVSAITNGTLGVRGPGVAKVTPLERLVRDIATGVLRRQATAKGLKWPHGKGSGDAVAAMVDAYLAVAKYRTAAESLAKQQLDAMATLAEGDAA
jgi:hypothetical protein